jgi:hypothetical protein
MGYLLTPSFKLYFHVKKYITYVDKKIQLPCLIMSHGKKNCWLMFLNNHVFPSVFIFTVRYAKKYKAKNCRQICKSCQVPDPYRSRLTNSTKYEGGMGLLYLISSFPWSCGVPIRFHIALRCCCRLRGNDRSVTASSQCILTERCVHPALLGTNILFHLACG